MVLYMLAVQVGFDVQPEVTWKSSYRDLKVHQSSCLRLTE